MNLKLTEFSNIEKKKKYELSNFNEMGLTIYILNETTKFHKIPSGNFYKFGLYSNGNYFWYWFGQPVADSREKMREIYSALLQITKDNEIPFIYKVKRV
jgi:hypothetical protein